MKKHNLNIKKSLIKNIISLFLAVIILLNLFAVNNYATPGRQSSNSSSNSGANFSITEVFSSVKEFNKRAESNKELNADEVSGNFAAGIKPIGEVLIGIAWVLSVGVAMILGVQYFASAADPGKQAKVKQGLVAFIIAIVILSMAFPIWRLTIQIVSKTTTSITGA